ncbi:hypothetical protein IFM89_037124, partial [Coptis chinensis]
ANKRGKSQGSLLDEINKAPAKRQRSITILRVISHVEYEIVNRHYTHVDCAGHANYVKEIPITSYYLEESQLCLEEDFFIQLASNLCGILGLLICGPHLSIAAKIGIAFGVFFAFLLIVVGSQEMLHMPKARTHILFIMSRTHSTCY